MELCGAFPEAVLNICAINAVVLWELECVNQYTLRVTVYEKQLDELRAAAKKSMCEMAVLEQRGGSRNLDFLRRRMWLLTAALIMVGILSLSSLFIWEIDLRGCDRLTEGQVLRALSDCGVEQGSFWPTMSADLVRSKMMTLLPELGWMMVNISGSRAIVLISERQEKPEIYLESQASDIVAKKTGIITRMSVLNGKPLVSRGQSVLEGETLVSGVMDSITNPPRYVNAQAQVIADTWYELTAVCPAQQTLKTEKKLSYSRFALKFGKNRIIFYFSSGKDIDECDKIVYEYTLGIDGLFALPVTVVREQMQYWEKSPEEYEGVEAMKQRLYELLQAQVDGEIISCEYSSAVSDELVYVTLSAQCRENIALNMDIAQGEANISVSAVKGFT